MRRIKFMAICFQYNNIIDVFCAKKRVGHACVYAPESLPVIVILIVRCCFGGLYVRDRLALLLFAHASHFCCFRPSVEELPRGWRTVAFPRWLHVLSCLTWLIVRCCINSYVLASLTLIVIVARSTDHPTLIARLDAAARGGASSTDAENPRELHDVPHILRIRETRRAE